MVRRRVRWRNFGDDDDEDFWAIATGQPTEEAAKRVRKVRKMGGRP